MVLPNLIIPGAAKSGTSSLHEYLNLHPDISMSFKKEPHFFTLTEKYEKGLGFYEGMWNENKKGKYYGESSTSYFPNKDALRRIKNTLDEVKFIVILRNPVERSISHYKWLVSKGIEKRRFRDAVQDNINKGINYRKRKKGGVWKGYYTTSLYGRHISYLYELFPQKNVLVITTEELAANHVFTLNKCFEFLEIDEMNVNDLPIIRKNITHRTKTSIRSKLLNNLKNPPSINYLRSRLPQLLINKNALFASITDNEKIWLTNNLKEDYNLFRSFHPDIVDNWKL